MLPSKVNKENFRLLDLSSDEESEDLQLEIIPSRKKKITRRERNRTPASHSSEPNFGTEVQCALRWAMRGTLLLWLFMLTWICATLYDHMSSMREDINYVSKTSSGVGDALHICHQDAKELRGNVSELSAKLAKLDLDHQELAKRVEKVTTKLKDISDQLKAEPNLAETPQRLADLQRTVADFGSQINGFDGVLSSAKKQAVTAASGVEEIRTLLHQLDERTNDTIANVASNLKKEEINQNDIATLNTTLTAKIESLQTRIQELSKPVSTAAPPVPTAAPQSAAPANNTATSTVPPGPPVKPVLLH